MTVPVEAPPVLVDTSAILAILDRADIQHPAAAQTMERLLADRASLIVHDHIVGEALALVDHRLGRRIVHRLIDDVLPAMRIVALGDTRFAAALAAHRAGSFGRVSFVDAASFLLMRELAITRAFAFDADFARAGFELLTA